MSSFTTDEQNVTKQTHALPTQATNVEFDIKQALVKSPHFKHPTMNMPKTLTPNDYAAKRKLFASFNWEVSGVNNLRTAFEITYAKLKKYIPMEKYNQFHSFDLVFDIQMSTNFLFQGMALLAYSPVPLEVYSTWNRKVGFAEYFTLDHIQVEAGVRKTMEFTIPMVFPFNFFESGAQAGEQFVSRKYLEDYPLGFIYFLPITALRTEAAITTIPVKINLQVKNYTGSGNRAQWRSLE